MATVAFEHTGAISFSLAAITGSELMGLTSGAALAGMVLSCRVSNSLARAIEERSRATGESIEHLVRRALAEYFQVEHGTLFQVSTAGALVEGLYQGEVTIGALREHGDFGLGTFDGLDGEMVVVDGHFYRVRGDGSVREVSDSVRTPYAMITRFPKVEGVVLAEFGDLGGLYAQLDKLRDSQNVFYAIRVDGEFKSITTRSVMPTPEGVPLVEAAAQQREFHLRHVRGSLMGFWSPGYLKTILVPGYHLHFLAEDRQSGGHLLGCAGQGVRVQMRREADFRVSLPESASFLHADLTRDPGADLDKAEK
jgi:acetolactate decarboxylase